MTPAKDPRIPPTRQNCKRTGQADRVRDGPIKPTGTRMTSYTASESGNRRAAAMRALKRSADGLVVVAGSAQGRANQ